MCFSFFQGDFGLAKPDMDANNRAYSFCGSPEYMAPEMLLKLGHTYTVDFYCLGALLYELVKNPDEIFIFLMHFMMLLHTRKYLPKERNR